MEQQNTFLLEAPLGKLMRGYAVPCIISLLTAALYNVVDQIFIGWGVGAAGNSATNIVFPLTVLALVLFQVFPVQLISIFSTDNSPLYFDFAKLAFRMYLCMMILDCVNKAAFIFLQSLGKPVESTLLSLLREVVLSIPLAILLPWAAAGIWGEVNGIYGLLASMPCAALLTFLAAVYIILRTDRQLHRQEAGT